MIIIMTDRIPVAIVSPDELGYEGAIEEVRIGRSNFLYVITDIDSNWVLTYPNRNTMRWNGESYWEEDALGAVL